MFLLLLEEVIPYLRGHVTQERDMEDPSGRNVRSDSRVAVQCHNIINGYFLQLLGIREDYYVWVCYGASSPSFFWQIFIFACLGILQLFGIVLAVQTRKVKIPGLRDSKFVAAIIYISSILLITLALETFALRTYINIGAGIIAAGIFSVTTLFLALIFIPKVSHKLHIKYYVDYVT